MPHPGIIVYKIEVQSLINERSALEETFTGYQLSPFFQQKTILNCQDVLWKTHHYATQAGCLSRGRWQRSVAGFFHHQCVEEVFKSAHKWIVFRGSPLGWLSEVIKKTFSMSLLYPTSREEDHFVSSTNCPVLWRGQSSRCAYRPSDSGDFESPIILVNR